MLISKICRLAGVLCLLVAITALSGFGGITGDQLQWDYYYGGGLLTNGGNTWTVPGSGGNFLGYFDVDADANSITFDYTYESETTWSSSPLSLAPTIYNGIAINLISGAPFTSVTVDPATNMFGFSASDISFTGSQIQVDWSNLPFDQSTIVKLDINNSSSVPEPCTWALAGVGAIALLTARKQRLSRSRK